MSTSTSRWAAIGLSAFCVLLGAAAPSTADLLREAFARSERVGYVEVTRAELEAAHKGLARKDKYVVYVATTGPAIDGFFVVDDEVGQHQPITFAFGVTADGAITSAAVLAYREAYGGEIKDPRFLAQLVGKRAPDALRVGDDVDGITGATLSSRSSTVAARRALVLAGIALHKQQARVAAR